MTVLYLFDIDGTLLHANGSGRGAFDLVFAERHGVPDASEGIRYGGKTDPALVVEIFQARLGRRPSTDELTEFLVAYIPILNTRLAQDGVQVLDGVVATLERLAATTDVLMGVATGNIRAGADAKLAAAKLERWFAFGGYGCDSHLRAELVARAIERARERTGNVTQVVVVGDTIHDIAAARACDALVCAVATGPDSADRLGDADAVFASMAELPAWHAQRFG